jgi:hypothetical protein
MARSTEEWIEENHDNPRESNVELYGLLTIFAVIAGFVFLLAVERSIISSLSSMGASTGSPTCDMCTSTVTKTKQPKMLKKKPPATVNSPTSMASLSPKEEVSIGGTRSLSPNLDIGSPTILMIWESRKGLAG